MLMIGVGRKERKGREKMAKSGAIKRQGIKMSEEADWDNERQRGGLRAFIDGLAQPKREHKDKQMRHTHTHTKVEPARPGDTEQTVLCVSTFTYVSWELVIAIIWEGVNRLSPV